jgi:enterobacterial common antigen flippase
VNGTLIRRKRVSSLFRALASASTGSTAVAQTFLVKLLTVGLNVGTGVVTARYLGPTGRAEQAAILLGAGLFPYLFALGVPLAIQYRIRNDPDNESGLISAATWLAIALGLLAAGVSYFILPHMIAKYSTSVLFAARLAMLTAPLAMLYTLLCSVLQAKHRFREANFTRYAIPFATLAALLALGFAHHLTPMTSAAAYLVQFAWAVPWLWAGVSPRLRLRGLGHWAARLLDYGWRSSVSDILGTLAAQVDQVLVIGLLSPVSMGIYAVAIGAARSADLFSGSVVTVLFPRASALDNDSVAALIARAARVTTALLFLSTLALIAVMPFLLPLFYGHVFSPSIPVAQLLVVSIALNGIVYVVSQGYMASGRPGVIAAIQIFGLATTVPLILFLVPRFGLIGAASALIVSTTVRLFFALAGFPIVLKVGPPSLLLNADDVSYLRRAVGLQKQHDAG